MHDHNHDELMQSVAHEYADILENSNQGIYIYLDDDSKVCNTKFAELLGYESPDVWAKIDTSFPTTFVATESQKALVSAYQDAMENGNGSTIAITWKKKDGSTLDTNVILVPVVYEHHLLALHFVTANK